VRSQAKRKEPRIVEGRWKHQERKENVRQATKSPGSKGNKEPG
jgi:hypothetical protein